jgi:hypothetical protein
VKRSRQRNRKNRQKDDRGSQENGGSREIGSRASRDRRPDAGKGAAENRRRSCRSRQTDLRAENRKSKQKLTDPDLRKKDMAERHQRAAKRPRGPPEREEEISRASRDREVFTQRQEERSWQQWALRKAAAAP